MTFVMTKMTSRQKILTYLDQHSGASALEISRALRLTAANIRYHLAILISEQQVQILGNRSDLGRGRPVQVFALCEAALGDNLVRLVSVLFEKLFQHVSVSEMDSVLELIAASLFPKHEGEARGAITRRLAQVIARLNKDGYRARWEAHAVAPQIIFEHCPYSAIIASHPEMCQIDARILGRLLDGQVEQTARLEKTSRGTMFCQFSIKNLAKDR